MRPSGYIARPDRSNRAMRLRAHALHGRFLPGVGPLAARLSGLFRSGYPSEEQAYSCKARAIIAFTARLKSRRLLMAQWASN